MDHPIFTKLKLAMLLIVVVKCYTEGSGIESLRLNRAKSSRIPRIPETTLLVRSIQQCAASCGESKYCVAANILSSSQGTHLDCQLFNSYNASEDGPFLTEMECDVLIKVEGRILLWLLNDIRA